jgi:hypothetical protein
MNNGASFPERLQNAFTSRSPDVLGLVDDLLELSREHTLQLDFRDGHFHIQPLGAEPETSIDVPLAKSIFRMMIARVAALCNERVPNSVSPYGGEGELWIRSDPSVVFRVAFTNTPSEQRLELSCLGDDRDEAKTLTIHHVT